MLKPKFTIQDLILNENLIDSVIKEHNIKKYRIIQFLEWILIHSVFDIDKMSNLDKESKIFFQSNVEILPIKVISQIKEEDTETTKILAETEDKLNIEIVVLSDKERKTVCLSSQIGCAMDCKFCATGKVGFARNLSSSEMLWQYLICKQLFGSIDNIVIMGMGEPLNNFNNVKDFIYTLVKNKINPYSARRITISTSGVKNFSKKMIELNLPVKLSISLHSPFDNVRKQMMPKSLGISELLQEAEYYKKETKKRITFEYILIDGITDTDESIEELIKITRKLSAFINLISYNEVDGIPYKNTQNSKKIIAQLEKANVEYSFRYKRGQKIKGACGQLVWERKK